MRRSQYTVDLTVGTSSLLASKSQNTVDTMKASPIDNRSCVHAAVTVH